MKDTVKKDSYTQEDLDHAVETLVDAGEILGNPELLKLLKEHAKSRGKQLESLNEISSIADLRKIANQNPKENVSTGKVNSIKELRNIKVSIEM